MALRRSFTSKTAPTQSPKEIPTELAMKIIETENEVLKSPIPLKIENLVSYYSEAIEFYSILNDLKYLDYQKRMHALLMNPIISQCLSAPKPIISSFEPLRRTGSFSSISPKISKLEEQQPKQGLPQLISPEKVTDEKINSGDVSPVSTCPSIPSPVHKELPKRHLMKIDGGVKGKNFRIIVDRHREYTKESTNKAIKDFKSQDSALNGRLASRKKQMLTKSMGNSSFTYMNLSSILEDPVNSESSQKGCFVIEEHPVEMDKFEMKLEEIMEKNFAQRASKIAEVRLKYESQISEMSNMGDLMQKVVSQMKSSMQAEISSVIEEFDGLRKEEIRKLKENRVV